MKKLLAVLLSAALLLSLAGCNQEPETTTGATTAETTVYVPDTTAAPETTAPAKGRENKLVYATAAQFNGDFAVGLFAGTARDIVGGNAAVQGLSTLVCRTQRCLAFRRARAFAIST